MFKVDIIRIFHIIERFIFLEISFKINFISYIISVKYWIYSVTQSSFLKIQLSKTYQIFPHGNHFNDLISSLLRFFFQNTRNKIWHPRCKICNEMVTDYISNFFFFMSMLQILQLQMNDYRYHYMFTTFVSIHQ